jgi:hypothetical protein
MTLFSQDISESSTWSNHFSTSTAPPPCLQTNTQKKPWLPKQECQFRCCHACRNNLGERAYLSLNGIANGDIPPTAITGYGFHVLRQRPVVRVELVKNLGLRPVPIPVSRRPPLCTDCCHSYIKASKTSSKRSLPKQRKQPKHRSSRWPRHPCR